MHHNNPKTAIIHANHYPVIQSNFDEPALVPFYEFLGNHSVENESKND